MCIAYQDNETLLEVVNATASALLLKRGRIMGKAFIASKELSHIPSINNIEIAKSFISRNATQEDFETDDDSLPPLISDVSDWSEENMLEQDFEIEEQTQQELHFNFMPAYNQNINLGHTQVTYTDDQISAMSTEEYILGMFSNTL